MTFIYCNGINTANVTMVKIKKNTARMAKQMDIYFRPLNKFHFLKKNQLQNPGPKPSVSS